MDICGEWTFLMSIPATKFFEKDSPGSILEAQSNPETRMKINGLLDHPAMMTQRGDHNLQCVIIPQLSDIFMLFRYRAATI